MKKKLLTTLMVLTAIASFGQTTFTNANEPAIGESRTLFLCDSNAVDFASTIGNGVLWNYGLTNTYAGQTRLLSIMDPSATPYYSDFPGSTTTAEIQDYISTFMSSDPNGRISQGYLIESVDLGVVKAKFSSDAENIMTYPFALNGQVTDIFAGNLSFTYNSIPQNPSCSGNSLSVYDGFGTLIQVNGISVSNISRFHIIDTTYATIPVVGNTLIIRNQFEYYDLAASNKTPIFIHSHVKIESGFPDPLVEMSVVLSSVPGTAVAGMYENKKNSILVYPNPAKGEVTISNLSADAVVYIVDLSGRTNTLERLTNNQFNLSNFSNGIYVLKIETDGKILTERLILK
jgi:hypothetical protein